MHKNKKNKKLNVEQFQDLDPVEALPSRRISRTLGYQNSQSIQEEDEENSSSNNIEMKPKHSFILTCPLQPLDQIGSDIKVPTIYTIAHSNKSDILSRQMNSKKQSLSEHYRLVDISDLQEIHDKSESNSLNSFIQKSKQSTLNQANIKNLVIQFIRILMSKLDPLKFIDPLFVDEEPTASVITHYKWITRYIFTMTSIVSLTSITLISMRIGFLEDIDSTIVVMSYIFQGINIIQTLVDIILCRGPIIIRDGQFITKYRNPQYKYYDLLRLVIVAVLCGLQQITWWSLLMIAVMIIQQNYRQCENFENIYESTQLITRTICQWISLIVYFTILLKYISVVEQNSWLNQDQSANQIEQCLTLAISLITHTNITKFMAQNTSETVIVYLFMILSTWFLIQNVILLNIWLKPKYKIAQEKQKLLSQYIEALKDKNVDYGLQCKCYNYLDFIIQEDLQRVKDGLTKKLSPYLQEELQISIRQNMMSKIGFFHKFSVQFRQQLIYWFDQIQYNPEDNILTNQQNDEYCFYYIIKGKVKVYFQGESIGKPKRTFTVLSEGQWFGEYSFITGRVPYMSVSSSGLTQILKLKRSDFLDLITTYKADNELFCQIQDNSIYNSNYNMFECYYCHNKGHLMFQCQYLQYYPKKETVIEKHLFPHKQLRVQVQRRIRTSGALTQLFVVCERAKAFQLKISQEIITSEDFPQSSQLPYSENQTMQSASYLSKSQSILKNSSPDQPFSNNNIEMSEDQDLINPLLFPDENSILGQDPFSQNLRKQQNKTTLKTAGFPFLESNSKDTSYIEGALLSKDKFNQINDSKVLDQLSQSREKMNEETNKISKMSSGSQLGQQRKSLKQAQTVQYGTSNTNTNNTGVIQPNQRSMHAKLTFRYQQQNSSGLQEESQQSNLQGSIKQQSSIRQISNRSNTYSNPISNNLSNNPSSNSRNNKSPKLSPSVQIPGQLKQMNYLKKKEESRNSEKSITETKSKRDTGRKKSTKTGTKISIMNQMSGFQIFNSPENHGYMPMDGLINRFEKMYIYTIYNPHNNYDVVIARFNKFQVKRRRRRFVMYSIKCYVNTKIRRMANYIQLLQ